MSRAGLPALVRSGVLGVLCLTACTVGPEMVRPTPPALAHYGADGDSLDPALPGIPAQHLRAGEGVRADWWTLFASPELDALVTRALAHAQSLESARALLARSEAERAAGEGTYFPQLDLSLDPTRQRTAPLRQGLALPGSVFSLYTLAASVGYRVDLFGERSRTVEGLSAQVDVDCAGLRASALALTGNVIEAALAAAAYRDQRDTTQALIGIQQQQIALLAARVGAGLLPASELLQAHSQLAEFQASAALLEQRLRASDDLLAQLSGEAPAEGQRPALHLAALQLPADLPLSLPAQLVRQRPDILVAEGRLRAANAAVGVATAQQLPDLTLNGELGRSALDPAALARAGGNFWSAGATLHQTLFAGGAPAQRRVAAEAAWQGAQADYRQAVLAALAQVADVLGALRHDGEIAAARRLQLDAASGQLALSEANRAAGRLGDTEWLSARAQLETARLAWQAAQVQRLQDTVALQVALGGGWWPAQRCGPLFDAP